jgi:hypothetical protein
MATTDTGACQQAPCYLSVLVLCLSLFDFLIRYFLSLENSICGNHPGAHNALYTSILSALLVACELYPFYLNHDRKEL